MSLKNCYKRKGKEGRKGEKRGSVMIRCRIVLDGLLVWSWVYLSCVGVVAQPLRRDEMLVYLWFLCGPFAARGAKGEAEYP